MQGMFEGIAIGLVFILVIVSVVTLAIGFSLGWYTSENIDWQKQAIQRGCALHCPATGVFAWKGECDV